MANMLKNLPPYLGAAFLGALSYWVLSTHLDSAHEFGKISVNRSIQSGLEDLQRKGVDFSKSTRIIFEPTTNCPNYISAPCLHIEAEYPSLPRSLNSNNLETFTSWEASEQVQLGNQMENK